MATTYLNKYLPRTVYILYIISVLIIAFVIYLQIFYVPSRKDQTNVSFVDSRDPSKVNIPSTTLQDLQNRMITDPQYLSRLENNNNTGNYSFPPAQLKQFCSTTSASQSADPDNYVYQQCDTGLSCVSDILQSGPICLAELGSPCNILSDCVPSANACLNSICTLTSLDKRINIPCKSDFDCQYNEFEDQVNNHRCYNNVCKYDLFPFDSGCRSDQECTDIPGHSVKCVKNNFKDTLFEATLRKDTNGTSVFFNEGYRFNIEALDFSGHTTFVRLMINKPSSNVKDEDNNFRYTVIDNGVCAKNYNLQLQELEFSGDNYGDLIGVSQVYITFGDKESITSLPSDYGACLDLLPVGSPSNYKIANIIIPGTCLTPTKNLDNIIVSTEWAGRANDVCVHNSEILKCGTAIAFGERRQLECGYNYTIEENVFDNIFYELDPDQYNIQKLGSCMLKFEPLNAPCNLSSAFGCSEPNLCLPVLNPENKSSLETYCIPPFRNQLCEANTCPAGYVCGTSPGTPGVSYCFSTNNSPAYYPGDCLNSSDFISGSAKLSIYSPELQEYITIVNFPPNLFQDIGNINLRLGKKYKIINKSEDLQIDKKTQLPEFICIFDSQNITDKNINIYQLDSDGKYQYYIATDIHIPGFHDFDFDTQNNLVIITKNKIKGLREFGFKLDPNFAITHAGGTSIATPTFEVPKFHSSCLIDNHNYECFLYTTDATAAEYFNIPITVTTKLNQNNRDVFEIQTMNSNLQSLIGTSFPADSYIFFNTNELAINNDIYFLNNPTPTNYDGNKNLGTIETENIFTTPIINRNRYPGLSTPEILNNYTVIENGDRIKLNHNLIIDSYTDYGTGDGIYHTSHQGDHLYIEKIQKNFYLDTGGASVPLENYIYYLHPDFPSSEGAAPVFGLPGSTFYNQHYNSANPTGVSFTLYDKMENYSLTFIDPEYLKNAEDITLNPTNQFIRYDYQNRTITNGINTSISYNFEEGTSVKFLFNQDNSMIINATSEGLSSYHTYVQKINYEIRISGTSIIDYDIPADQYDYLFQNSYSSMDEYRYSTIYFKYTDQIIAPKPKSFYFTEIGKKQNFIDTVEENLFDPDENSFSIFTTFKNDEYLLEGGDINPDNIVFNTANKNVYANKAPPIAAYSRYNGFGYEGGSSSSISFNYTGLDFLNDEKYSAIEMGNSIQKTYSNDYNCIGNHDLPIDTTTITIRDPDIIDIFLNNPSSEIVMQKHGPSLHDYYVESDNDGISTIMSYLRNASPSFTPDGTITFQAGISSVYRNKLITYDDNILEEKMKTTKIELNRSVVSIKEYNIIPLSNNNFSEYIVLKLNTSLNISDEYQRIILEDQTPWKLWIHNFVSLNYFNDLGSILQMQNGTSTTGGISIIKNTYKPDVFTILDASVLWNSCKGDKYNLPSNYTRSSYNKIIFTNDDNKLDIMNIHDGYYYYKTQTLPSSNNAPPLTSTELSQLRTVTDEKAYTYGGPRFCETFTNFNSIAPYVNIDQNYSHFDPSIHNLVESPSFGTHIKPKNVKDINENNDVFFSNPNTYLVDLRDATGAVLEVGVNWTYNIYREPSDYDNFKSIPQKIPLFSGSSPIRINDSLSVNIGSDLHYTNISNDSFVYFKKRYMKNINTIKRRSINVTDIDLSIRNNYLYIMGNNYGPSNYVFSSDFNPRFYAANTNINTRTYSNSFKILSDDFGNNIEDTFSYNRLGLPLPFNVNLLFFTHFIENKTTIYTYNIFNSGPSKNVEKSSLAAELEIAPLNSGNINKLSKYGDYYTGKLYMINNLFLSTLPPNISNFTYIGLNILKDNIISNLYYVEEKDGTVKTKFKGLGLTSYSFNRSPVISNYFKNNINELNQINYKEIRFPLYFTERYISRFNTIPVIYKIFASIREGNIFDKLRYYALINYSPKGEGNNYQIVHLTTDINIETVLENRAVPFTTTLSTSYNSKPIYNKNLTNLIKFEPYNNLLFVLSSTCSN